MVITIIVVSCLSLITALSWVGVVRTLPLFADPQVLKEPTALSDGEFANIALIRRRMVYVLASTIVFSVALNNLELLFTI